MSFWCHRFDQNSNENIVRIPALNFFVASWGLPGRFLGLPGDLVSNIINKEACRKPQKDSRKPQKPIKTFTAEILTLFSLLLWSKRWHLTWPDVSYFFWTAIFNGSRILPSLLESVAVICVFKPEKSEQMHTTFLTGWLLPNSWSCSDNILLQLLFCSEFCSHS